VNCRIRHAADRFSRRTRAAAAATEFICGSMKQVPPLRVRNLIAVRHFDLAEIWITRR